MTEYDVQEMVEQYCNGGKTIEQIARQYHIRQSTVSDAIKSCGIEIKWRTKNKNLNEHYFDDIDSSEKAYFLGLLFADGSITKSKDRSDNVRIELVESDVGIIEKLKGVLNSGSSIAHTKRHGRERGTCVFAVRSDILASALIRHGVLPRKTYDAYKIPTVATEFERDLLRGLIDGNGSIFYSGNSWHVSFCSHNKELCESFDETASRVIGKIHRYKPSRYNDVYHISFNGENAIKLIEACWYDDSVCAIDRKRSLANRAKEKQVDDIV